MNFPRFVQQIFSGVLAWLVLSGSLIADLPPAGPRVALRMASSPEYELQGILPREFDKRLVPLWMSALDLPERDLHRQVGDAVVRAKRLGMPGLDESVAVKLRKAFEASDHAVVRRSIAAALVALDDQKSADILWEASQRDYQLALIVEPALGQWKHPPAIAAALARLEDSVTPHPLARLAIEMLANAREEKARQPLLKFVQSARARGDLRLAAASALGEIFPTGLTSDARGLFDRERAIDLLAGLLAVRMLANHRDSASVALLQKLARDGNSAVQALALKRLVQIDHNLAANFALDPQLREEFSVRHPDANVRLLLIESLYSIADAQAIPVLRAFLDDPHPVNRTAAGDALYHLALKNADFRESVLQEVLGALADSSWRTLERAAIVAGGLDGEACSDALVRLLAHPRKEVAVASAWALKEIAVPETLPMALDRLRENLDTKYDLSSERGQALLEIAEQQSLQLNEQLGLMKYRPAEPTLRRLIPQMDKNRNMQDPIVRATAIWALGLIHEDKPNPELTALLMTRLNMLNSEDNPESEIVGEASAYAAGWMRDASGVNVLQGFASHIGVQRNVLHAAAWAMERITGKPLPLQDPIQTLPPRWFLEPAKAPDQAQ